MERCSVSAGEALHRIRAQRESVFQADHPETLNAIASFKNRIIRDSGKVAMPSNTKELIYDLAGCIEGTVVHHLRKHKIIDGYKLDLVYDSSSDIGAIGFILDRLEDGLGQEEPIRLETDLYTYMPTKIPEVWIQRENVFDPDVYPTTSILAANLVNHPDI